MTIEPNEDQIRKLAAQIVTSYVSGNEVAPDALPTLIRSIYTALSEVNQPVVVPVEKPVPAVSPRKSVFPDYIVCLEDGKKLKLLRRHLKTAYNMTPQQYRERWELPAEYPMVAPNYANHRSSLARKIGLGTRRES